MEERVANGSLLDFIRSIDHRLELVNAKLDDFKDQVVTKADCDDCRRSIVDKRYFLGWGSCFVLASLGIGLAIKFL